MVQMKSRSLLDSPNTNSELLEKIGGYYQMGIGPVHTWHETRYRVRYLVLKIGLFDSSGLYSGYLINCRSEDPTNYWVFYAPIDLVEEIEENYRDYLTVYFYALGFDQDGFPKFQVIYDKSGNNKQNIFSGKKYKFRANSPIRQ